jgi:large subunit ribosomal protein L36
MTACANASAAQGLSAVIGIRGVVGGFGDDVGTRGFKIVSALRRRCRDCRIVKRGKKIYVLCETSPRHKQRQGKGGSRYQPS